MSSLGPPFGCAYSTGPCVHHLSHPQLGTVSALALALRSFRSYFPTDLQLHAGHLPTWDVPLSVPYLFAFSYCSWGSQGKNTEVVCHSLLQWPTFYQTSPPWPFRLGWPHTAWLSFTESNKGIQRIQSLAHVWLFAAPWTTGSSVHGIFQAGIVEWAAIPFSRGSSWPRDQTRVSLIVSGRFTVWATREVIKWYNHFTKPNWLFLKTTVPLCKPNWLFLKAAVH